MIFVDGIAVSMPVAVWLYFVWHSSEAALCLFPNRVSIEMDDMFAAIHWLHW